MNLEIENADSLTVDRFCDTINQFVQFWWYRLYSKNKWCNAKCCQLFIDFTGEDGCNRCSNRCEYRQSSYYRNKLENFLTVHVSLKITPPFFGRLQPRLSLILRASLPKKGVVIFKLHGNVEYRFTVQIGKA